MIWINSIVWLELRIYELREWMRELSKLIWRPPASHSIQAVIDRSFKPTSVWLQLLYSLILSCLLHSIPIKLHYSFSLILILSQFCTHSNKVLLRRLLYIIHSGNAVNHSINFLSLNFLIEFIWLNVFSQLNEIRNENWIGN